MNNLNLNVNLRNNVNYDNNILNTNTNNNTSFSRFFFMGCWNSDNDIYDYRKQVIEYIIQNSILYDYGVFGGDNIYNVKDHSKKNKSKNNKSKNNKSKNNKSKNNKSKPEKKSKKDKLLIYTKGTTDYFHKIKHIFTQLNLPIYIILGNHDIKKKCIQSLQERTFQPPITHLFTVNTIKENQFDITFYLNTNKDISEFVNKINTFTEIPEFNKWIILIGHEPLTSNKIKKTITTSTISKLTTIYNNINKTNYKKIVYLCADTHNFQLIEVFKENHDDKDNIKIPIIVAGTGGTHTDEIDIDTFPKFNESIDIVNTPLKLKTYFYEHPYGYCDITIYRDEIILIYKYINNEDSLINLNCIDYNFSIISRGTTINSEIIVNKENINYCNLNLTETIKNPEEVCKDED